MLVLTRKSKEAVRLGAGIKITVLDVKGNQVRLGIEAPHELPVYREEVYEKVLLENRLAAGATVDVFTQVKERLGKNG